MKVGIYTLGCKVNTYESEYVASLFREKGYTISSFDDICDVYIINTCTVTNQSDVKSRKIIHQAIRKNKDACTVAMGCYIEANKEIELDGVDILVGNKDKSKVVELVEQYFKTREEIRNLYQDLGTEFEDMEITKTEGRARAFVKIQDGCENFCSYCIIPFVRGKCRSKKEEKVLEEIKTLVKNGYQEIVLTGIHTGNYGVDLNTDFASLLEKIVSIDGLYRIRISSIEITELNDRVLDILKNNKIIASHLHIPLQSGSEEILKLMNRKYNKDYYRKKIETIREIRPDISITTDVIVGFPMETEELFQESYEFCKEMNFSKIHVFPYSIRSGTAASKFKNQVDGNIKKERAKQLIELSNKLEEKYMSEHLNKQLEVLIEQNKDGFSYGHTSNYLSIKIPGEYQSEEIKTINISKIEYPYCIGEIIE
ncbi:MAG: tRNA (N(6)-L-threonylcarbamoyladenosine(37)-C(2))-methylthiotransferase MtaB [Firmicutes bacterium]|nr:tRNA (N(6)-L-threonylcarbamoyladenosine(37)-C(2))-methylthiotransferase MtaB [Bacillota bacterium]